jgi:hypothetical protein
MTSWLIGMIRIIPGTLPHDVWITCDECDAMWLGQPFDECEWCAETALVRERNRKQAILFPEFIHWDDRYTRLSPINREVWQRTRGMGRDFESSWQQQLFNAITHNVVTGYEAKLALERYSKWKATHSQPSGD